MLHLLVIVILIHWYLLYIGEKGEILAKQLASLGAKLIISARNEAELQHVKQQLKGNTF